MEDKGVLLLVPVFLLGVIAVVLVASSARSKSTLRERRLQREDAGRILDEDAGRKRSRVVSNKRNKEQDDDGTRVSPLLLPPADEARIEAVAPRNDTIRKL